MSERLDRHVKGEVPSRYSELVNILKKQRYHFAGLHTVVKKCHWTHMALVEDRYCYKCKFYGIESHRCIQMSPTAFWCWNACLHCWRIRPQDIGIELDETRMSFYEEPKLIVDKTIEEQRRILSGYKGHPRVDLAKLEEAMNPKHVAISLTGEPTLYPLLGDLIKEYHKRGMTTFLVTRGVRPDVLSNLEEEPSQLYISIEAHNKRMYNWFNNPLVPRAWELTLESLELMSTFKNPTVLRITVLKGINMSEEDAKEFARIIKLADPTYIEVKAYMYVGASRKRLRPENMPRHEDVVEFSKLISKYSGVPIRSQSMPSRIVLLSYRDKPIRHGKGCPWGWKGRPEEEKTIGEYEVED